MLFTLKKDSSVLPRRKRAQTAIEYLLVLGVVTAICLVGFRLYVPLAREDVNRYYLSLLRGVYGNQPPWDPAFNSYP
ncbi:MAG: hypothetical protein WC450_12400 [Candidatus Omnitrophota bacterium]|jgi:tRNA isopentenyl-2-thiomethyl-A-37 hydroxylase MiaE